MSPSRDVQKVCSKQSLCSVWAATQVWLDTVTSSKPAQPGVPTEGRVSDSLTAATGEPVKRQRESKPRRAKNAAKVRGRSSRVKTLSLDDYDVDNLGDVIPEDHLRTALTKMGSTEATIKIKHFGREELIHMEKDTCFDNDS